MKKDVNPDQNLPFFKKFLSKNYEKTTLASGIGKINFVERLQ